MDKPLAHALPAPLPFECLVVEHHLWFRSEFLLDWGGKLNEHGHLESRFIGGTISEAEFSGPREYTTHLIAEMAQQAQTHIRWQHSKFIPWPSSFRVFFGGGREVFGPAWLKPSFGDSHTWYCT